MGAVSAVAGSYPISVIRANRVPGTVVGAGVTKRKQTDTMQRGQSSRCTLGVLRERRTRKRVGAGHSGDWEGATVESGPVGGELDAQGASQRRRCEAANAGRWALGAGRGGPAHRGPWGEAVLPPLARGALYRSTRW